jgi:hypothetical protein
MGIGKDIDGDEKVLTESERLSVPKSYERTQRRPIDTKLPTPGTTRWTAQRKEAVVGAVEAGLLSRQEACCRYSLTIEEFLSWQLRLAQHGRVGLQTKKIKQHRLKFHRQG